MLCQKLLKFSRKVDECKPLRGGRGGGSIAATEVEVAALNGDDDADDGEFNPGDWANLMHKAIKPMTEEDGAGKVEPGRYCPPRHLQIHPPSFLASWNHVTWPSLSGAYTRSLFSST